jgi:hypothetical protein
LKPEFVKPKNSKKMNTTLQNSTTTPIDFSNCCAPVLHLNLKSKWFDMIACGEKKEEYREIKPYWGRLFQTGIKIKGRNYHPSDVVICFSNGYAKDRKQMLFKCKNLATRTGRPEWGAEPNQIYYVLLLGERLA